MSFYTCVIVNPASSNGGTGRRWPELRAALDKVLDRWDHQFTTGPGDGTRLAREAVAQGYEMIVSVGGDGTMNEVVTGLFPTGDTPPAAPTRPDIVLSPVRQGTGGDFARLLELPGEIPACVAHLAGDRVRACDLGIIEFVRHDGAPGWRGFLNIASFGLSGLVVAKVNKSSKVLGGKASFALGLARALGGYSPQAVRIMADDVLFLDETMVTCAVANGQYFGGGMRFASESAFDDGMFDVVAQLKSGLREILSVGDLYSGRMAEWPSVRKVRAREVHAEATKPHEVVLLDIDGEGLGRLPARFRIVPSAIRLKC